MWMHARWPNTTVVHRSGTIAGSYMIYFDDRAAAVLGHLGAPDAPLLGSGGEGRVYALGAGEVVKVYAAGNSGYLEALAALHARLAAAALPFDTPVILEIGELAGTWYTRERRLRGRRWEEIFGLLALPDKHRMLDNYLTALRSLHAVEMDNQPYGQALQLPHRLSDDSWPAFLLTSADRVLGASAADLESDVTDFQRKLATFRALVSNRVSAVPKRLIHGDYFPGNLLFGERREVSAVLDFSPHTLAGDPLMDVAGAVAFLDAAPLVRTEHVSYLRGHALATYGASTEFLLDLYTLYYAFYFSDTKRADTATYTWCLRHLNDAALWARLER